MLILLNTRDVFCALSCHNDGKTSTVANIAILRQERLYGGFRCDVERKLMKLQLFEEGTGDRGKREGSKDLPKAICKDYG
jgi:hypothetical protein